jgi:hypothetical protein
LALPLQRPATHSRCYAISIQLKRP